MVGFPSVLQFQAIYHVFDIAFTFNPLSSPTASWEDLGVTAFLIATPAGIEKPPRDPGAGVNRYLRQGRTAVRPCIPAPQRPCGGYGRHP